MKSLRIVAILLVMLILTTGVVFAAESISHGDKLVLFKTFEVNKDEMMRGDIIAIFSTVNIDGMVDGGVISIFGDLEINGTVDGDVVSVLGRANLGDNATITKDKIQILSDIGRDSNASVGGDVINIISFKHQLPGIAILLISIIIVLIIKNVFEFILSVILLVSIPERIDKITDATTKRVGRRFGIGVLTVVLFYATSAVLGVTVIAAPVVFILVLAKWLLGLGGKKAIKLVIGQKFDRKKKWSRITHLILGSLVYLLIDITIVGSFILYFGKLVGMGAIVDTRIGTTDQWNMSRNKHSDSSPTYTVVNKEDEKNINSLIDQTHNTQETVENSDDKVSNNEED